MRNRYFLALLFSLLLFSCKKNNEVVPSETVIRTVNKDSAKINSDKKEDAFNLQKFGFPEEVEGCSCYIAENREDFENEKFIYIDDYQKSAYLKIGGKLIKIPMKDGDFDPENFSKNHRNDSLEIKITGKKILEMDETMMFSGEMTVRNSKSGRTITSTVYGECGC